ncbi:hypothetical protein DSCO28_54320 [Desulfosarcina ovata subsp. sediminis]|uniref:DUF4384 domain-containing protein n=2 Tax=Desulfosarcina ovata TaxID=83564 RepID=A0A5K7ZXG9_9BACT|nr:hypothetical protein DSCO28_54320 [Desulfosarcina ovata subsp. sediminis]
MSGKIDRDTLTAIDQYANEINEYIDRKIGPDLYCHLFFNMPFGTLPTEKPLPPDEILNNPSKALQSDSAFIELNAALIYTPRWSSHPLRLKSGGRMMSGDRYKFLIMPEKDCYLYIFQSDASGQFSMLFPMDSFRGVRIDNRNPVKGQLAYELPGPKSSFILDERRGIERIYVIAVPESDTQLEELGRQLNKAQNDESHKKIGRELMDYLNTKSLTHAALPGVTFNMDGKGGNRVKINAEKLQTSKERVYLMEFEHR